MKVHQQESTGREKKCTWCEWIPVLTMVVLFMCIFDLQISRGEEMSKLSEQNRVRIYSFVAVLNCSLSTGANGRRDNIDDEK